MFLARKKKMERELLAVLKWHVAICIYNAIENGVGKLCKNFLLVFYEHGRMATFWERIICNINIIEYFSKPNNKYSTNIFTHYSQRFVLETKV